MKSIRKIILIALICIIAIMMFGVNSNVFADDASVAKIGDTEYDTVEAAFEASTNGDTIILLKDAEVNSRINVNSDVTLNLNGKTLLLKGGGPRKIWNYATLTINGNGILRNEDGYYDTGMYGLVDNFSILNIENGTFIDNGGANGSSFRNNTQASEGATINISSGTFLIGEATYGNAIVCNNKGTVNITGGRFDSKSGGKTSGAYAIINNGGKTYISNVEVVAAKGAIANNKGQLIVNSGTFVGQAYYGIWITNDGKTTDVEINGGTFYGDLYGLRASVDDGKQDLSDAAIIVNGGDFSGGTAALRTDPEVSQHVWDLSLKGGKYSNDVSKYVANGYAEYKLADDEYVVSKDVTLTQENDSVYVKVNEETEAGIVIPSEVKNIINVIHENDKVAEFDKDKSKVKGLQVGTDKITIELPKVGDNIEKSVTISVYDIVAENKESEEETTVNENIKETVTDTIKKALENESQDLLGFTEEEYENLKDAVISGQILNTELVAEKMEEPSESDVKLIEKVIEEEETKVAEYYDVSVILKANGIEIAKIKELEKPITIALPIPEEIEEVKEGYERKYAVIRIHDGVAEVIAEGLTAEEGKVLIETDKFSTYALTYTDTEKAKEDNNTEEPKDNQENESVEDKEKVDESKKDEDKEQDTGKTDESKKDDAKNQDTAKVDESNEEENKKDTTNKLNPSTGDKITIAFVTLVVAGIGFLYITKRK